MGLNMEKHLKPLGLEDWIQILKLWTFEWKTNSNIILLHIKFKFKANVAAHRKQVQSLYGAKHGQTI